MRDSKAFSAYRLGGHSIWRRNSHFARDLIFAVQRVNRPGVACPISPPGKFIMVNGFRFPASYTATLFNVLLKYKSCFPSRFIETVERMGKLSC